MTLTTGLFFLMEFFFKFLTKFFFLKISVTFFTELYYEILSQNKNKSKTSPWKLQWLKTVGLKWQIHKLFLGICLKDEFHIWLIQH